jgi:hypothetical protein
MSGGHFDYNQYKIQYIIESIEEEIEKNEYPKDIITEFKKGLYTLKQAYIYTWRIDYLLSGNDGENSFRKRLKEDLKEIEHLNPIQALWGGETGY